MTVKKEKENKIDKKGKNIEDIKHQRNPLVTSLESFGLSKNEAIIYVYLLERGVEVGGSKIALGTQLHRQYVYNSLPTLLELGLIVEIEKGMQSKYKAVAPNQIEKIARRKSVEASDLSMELKKISKIGHEQDFEVIQGVKAIQDYEQHIVAEADATNWECYIIGGGSVGYAEVMGDLLDEHLSECEKKKLKIKYIGSQSEIAEYAKYLGLYNNQEYRFLNKLPDSVTHLVVRQDSVSFYSFLNPPLVYIVKSKVVAQNYKDFFMMLWEMAENQQ